MGAAVAVPLLGTLAIVALRLRVLRLRRQRTPGTESGTRTHHNPFTRLALAACGVKRNTLAQTGDLELAHYQSMGTAVLLTAVTAVCSMVLALTLAFPGLTWWMALPVGLLYGCFIFTIDRGLTSMPLNSPRFAAGASLGEVSARDRGLRPLLRVAPALLLRLTISVAIGLLIAEPILLKLFEPEITNRVELIRQATAEENGEAVRARYDQQIADLEKPQEGADKLDEVQAELDDAKRARDDAQKRQDQAFVLRDNECKGNPVNVAGRQATGRAGCGPAAAQYQADADLAGDDLSRAEGRVDELTAELTDLQAGVGRQETERREALSRKRQDRDTAVAKAQDEAALVDGLLVRIKALEELTADDTPFSRGPEPGDGDASTPTGGATSSAVAGSVDGAGATVPVRAVSNPETSEAGAGLVHVTTLGVVVWLVRIWLVVLDTTPVLLKAMHALGYRRPVDEREAQAAELAHHDSLRKVSESRDALDAVLAGQEAAAAARRGDARSAAVDSVGAGRRQAVQVELQGTTHLLTVGGPPLPLDPQPDGEHPGRRTLLFAVPGADGIPHVVQYPAEPEGPRAPHQRSAPDVIDLRDPASPTPSGRGPGFGHDEETRP